MTPDFSQRLRRIGNWLRIGAYIHLPTSSIPSLHVRAKSASSAGSKNAALFSPRNHFKKSVLKLDSDFVYQAIKHDVLVPHHELEDCFVLSEVGRAVLRRLVAKTDVFRMQHQIHTNAGLEDSPLAQRNATQTPLEWLRVHQNTKRMHAGIRITDIEFAAGEALRNDFDRGQMTPKMCVNWSRPIVNSSKQFHAMDGSTQTILDARARFFKALDYAGPGMADILTKTCCNLQGIGQSEKELGWPRRSGKLILKLGLARLSVFYGL